MDDLNKTIGTKVNEEMYQKINNRVKEKGYSSIAEYLRDLIRRDLEK